MNKDILKEEEEKEDPVKKLEEIDDKYSAIDSVDAPETLGLEKKEMVEMSDDEIVSIAKDKVGDADSGKKTIEDDYAKKIDMLTNEKEERHEKSKANQEYINQTFDNNAKTVSDQALKRGLARSSIIIGQIASVESQRAKELTEEMNSVNKKFAEIENEVKNLNAEKETALDNFDLAYAKKLEKAISDKREELEKQKQEIIEFNNKVDELEAEYKISLDKQKQAKAKSNMEMKEKYGYTPNELKAADEKYNYMIAYIDTLSKQEAISLLLNDEKIQKLLGDKFMSVYAYARNRK